MEPRSHFLLHEDATDDVLESEVAQPSYRYGITRMKSRPLKTLPHTQQLSIQVEEMCKRTSGVGNKEASNDGSAFWNIGVNPVLYRDGRDKIGFHADDDQQEELILCVLVSSPRDATRNVVIRPKFRKKEKTKPKHGEDEFQLCLDAGDAYSMDGK